MYCAGVIFWQIIKICLEYIVYDPNYNYDGEHDDDSMETDDDDGDAEYVVMIACVIVHFCNSQQQQSFPSH